LAALQAMPFAFFIGSVDRWVLPASQLLLKCLEVDKFQTLGLRHPDWVALRVFVEQAERSCGCEIASHVHLQFRLILHVTRLAVSDEGHVKV